MNTSLQASGGRHLAPAMPGYPWRCIIMEQHEDGLWSIASVFEMESFEAAELEALEICTEPYPDGIVAMHYVIGEVGND